MKRTLGSSTSVNIPIPVAIRNQGFVTKKLKPTTIIPTSKNKLAYLDKK